MTSLAQSIERHHQAIILSFGAIILFFLASCALNDVLPICHYVFGCDHAFHSVS